MANLILDYYQNQKENITSKQEEIFALVKKHDNKLISDYLEKSNDYEVLYHLASQRGNIFVPCLISKNDQCLEIGSECGALSASILRYTENLDSIEVSKYQSEINLERNKEHDSFNIYVGDFEHISPKLNKKYDKIFIIGSLAKASLYCPHSDNPYVDLLNGAKKLLKDNGELFIAIENKYGMKYFNGAKEDHTGHIFESIEGYNTNEYRTFSSIQLRKMLSEVGFKNIYFYYPLPDYKFSNVIYSEDYLPKLDGIANVGHSLDRDRAVIFNEDKALCEAADSDMFEIFANSFLIKVGK